MYVKIFVLDYTDVKYFEVFPLVAHCMCFSDPLSTTASYTLTVGDVNDNPPRFSQDLYQISLDQLSAGKQTVRFCIKQLKSLV